ncbi:Ubiquitin-associated domain [Trinorchestia longiramus]|nr:Ubiquitin-associated domain [Trinorchestia longiramus]
MADEPGSYVSGVPVRISEAFRPPRKVSLPSSCPHEVDAELLTEEYDVMVETSAISWIEDYDARKAHTSKLRRERIEAYRQRKLEQKAKMEEERKQQEKKEQERRIKQMEEEEERKRLARLEEERLEIEKERAELERLGKEMLEKEKLESVRIKNEKIEKEKAEKERLMKEKAEQIRMEQINMARLTKDGVREKISSISGVELHAEGRGRDDGAESSLGGDQAPHNEEGSSVDISLESKILCQDSSGEPVTVTNSASEVTVQYENSIPSSTAPSTTKIKTSIATGSNTVTNPDSCTGVPISKPEYESVKTGNLISINYADFEGDRNDPFDSAALKSINDMEELAQILQSSNVSGHNFTSQGSSIPFSEASKSENDALSGLGIIPGFNTGSHFSQFPGNAYYTSGQQVPYASGVAKSAYPSESFSMPNSAVSSGIAPAKMVQYSLASSAAPSAYSNLYYQSWPHHNPMSNSSLINPTQSSNSNIAVSNSPVISSTPVLQNNFSSYGYGLPVSATQILCSNESASYSTSNTASGGNMGLAGSSMTTPLLAVQQSQQLHNMPLIPKPSVSMASVLPQPTDALPAAPSERPDLEDFYSRYYGGLKSNKPTSSRDNAASDTRQSLRSSQSVPDLTDLEDHEVSSISDGSAAPINRPLSSIAPQSRPSSTGPALSLRPSSGPLLDPARPSSGPALDQSWPSTHTSPVLNYCNAGVNPPPFSSPASPPSFTGLGPAVVPLKNPLSASNFSASLNYGQYTHQSNSAYAQNALASHHTLQGAITSGMNYSSVPGVTSFTATAHPPNTAPYNASHSQQSYTVSSSTAPSVAIKTLLSSHDVKTSLSYTGNLNSSGNTQSCGSSSSSASSTSESIPAPTVLSPLELPDPFLELDSDVQNLVCSVAEMGFPRARVARAVQRLGTQHKKLIEVLLELQRLEEEGEEAGRAEVAFYAHLGDSEKTKLHLAACRQVAWSMTPHSAWFMTPHSAWFMTPHSAWFMTPHSAWFMTPHSAWFLTPHSARFMMLHLQQSVG